MNIILQAFPSWTENLYHRTQTKIIASQHISTVESVQLKKRFQLGSTSLQVPLRSIDRRASITKVLLDRYVPEIQVERNVWFDTIHLVLIIISTFTLPLVIGFDIDLEHHKQFFPFEVIFLIEGCIYIAFNSYKIREALGDSFSVKGYFKAYYERGLIFDLIAISPFNIILYETDTTSPVGLIAILRALRLVTILRVPYLFERIEFTYLQLAQFVSVSKTIYFLVILWHWSSCLWFFVNNSIEDKDDYKWMNYNKLDDEDLDRRYFMSIYLTMNIVTSVGYGDMFGTTNTERITIMFIILVGDALFAVAFGMMAALASGNESDFQKYMKELQSMREVLDTQPVPKNLVDRMERFFAYKAAMNTQYGTLDMRLLSKVLPETLFNKIMFDSSVDMISAVPIFQFPGNERLLQTIAICLRPEIYLPHDYLIYKDDVAEEMYFIIEGSVDIITTDNKRILKSLSTGDFVGEMALLNNNKRACSVICNSFCFIYILKKKDFMKIMERHESIFNTLRQTSVQRNAELPKE